MSTSVLGFSGYLLSSQNGNGGPHRLGCLSRVCVCERVCVLVLVSISEWAAHLLDWVITEPAAEGGWTGDSHCARRTGRSGRTAGLLWSCGPSDSRSLQLSSLCASRTTHVRPPLLSWPLLQTSILVGPTGQEGAGPLPRSLLWEGLAPPPRRSCYGLGFPSWPEGRVYREQLW